MKILELNIIEFGGLKDKNISLFDGLNIFEGENESGKSTVMLFIKFMLYGLPRKGSEERDRAVNRRSHVAKGSMIVLFEDEKYRIERSFSELTRSSSERKSIFRCADGEEVFIGLDAGDAFLKVPKEVFESTCGIAQSQCSDIGGKKGLEAIRNILSTADENTDIGRIEDKLDKIRVSYRHKSGKGGRLYELGEKINSERINLEKAVENEKRINVLRDKLKRSQDQLDIISDKLNKTSLVLTEMGKIEILRSFEKIKRDKGELGLIQKNIDALKKQYLKTEHMPTESLVAALRAQADQLENAQLRLKNSINCKDVFERDTRYDESLTEVGEKVEDMGGRAKIIKNLSKHFGRKKIFILLSLLIGLIALAVLIFGSMITQAVPLMYILGVCGIICSLGCVFVAISCSRKINNICKLFGKPSKMLGEYLILCESSLKAKRERMRRLGEYDAEIEISRKLVKEASERLAFIAQKTLLDCPFDISVDEARKEADRLSVFINRYSELDRKYTVLQQIIGNAENELSSYDEKELRKDLQNRDIDKLEAVDIRNIEKEYRFYKSQMDTLEYAIKQAQIELISSEVSCESPIEISDRLSLLKEKYNTSEKYYGALTLTAQSIHDAAEQLRGSVTPALGRNASSIMESLSNGKYSLLNTGNDLLPSLTDEDGFKISADLLSGGTRDVAYISLRIALMMQVYGPSLPPLMMDETLSQIDDKRAEKFLYFISHLCDTGLQTLLFTCHGRESVICQKNGIDHNIIVL